MGKRIFYELLERVGGNGRYQTITLCAWSVLTMLIGSSHFFLPYMFYQDNYQCPAQYSSCKQYVCSLHPNERTQYVRDDLFSLASKFGDYRCDSNVELDRLQSFIYFGGVVGVLVGAFTNEITTKRILLIMTVIINIVGLGTALLGQTLLFSSIGLFMNSSATSIEMVMLECYIVETVSEDVRGKHTITTYIFYSLGVTLNGFFFYLLRDYQFFLIILVFAFLTLLLMLIFYIEETPFDLIINFTPEESLRALRKIALANGREIEHNITLLELENIKKEFQENEQKKQHCNISILDLFRYDSLRTLTIVSLALHYVTCFQFSAPEIAIRNYSLSIYTNGVVIGFAELVGSAICYFTVDHYERKKIIYITQAICIATSVPVFLFFSCQGGTCTIYTQVMQTIGLTIFRLGASIAYNFFYMIQYEAFPNQIRGLALQVVGVPSYFAPVILPQIITFCESSGISIVFTFILCSVIMIAMMVCLSQTFGIPPPEIIDELKYQHNRIEDPNMPEK